jgi:hypothetical protein
MAPDSGRVADAPCAAETRAFDKLLSPFNALRSALAITRALGEAWHDRSF